MSKRTFWTGALWGAAIAYIADDLVRRGLRRKRRLSLVNSGASNVVSLDNASEAAASAELQPAWSPSRPVFQRRANSGAAVPLESAAEPNSQNGVAGER